MNNYKQDIQTRVGNLPIFSGVNMGDIKLSPIEFRPGEKPVFNIVKLGILAGVGALVWFVLLPILATMFAAFLAVLYPVVICGLLLLLFLGRKQIYELAKIFVTKIYRNIKEMFIRWDPFGTFVEQRKILLQQEEEAIQKGTIIATTESKMKEQALKYEQKAKLLQTRLKEIQSIMQELTIEKAKYITDESKQEDRYSDIVVELTDLNAEFFRVEGAYNQSKQFVTQFGTLGNTMTKFRQKYKMYLSFAKNKVLNFDATVEQLRAEFDASNAIKSGTDAIKGIGLFDNKWEVMYASEVVVGTIANNIAMSKNNMIEINETMGLLNSDMSSDKALEKLDALMKNIEAGSEIIPSAKRYNNPDLKLTTKEKESTNGLGDIF